ncbi:hypothetical protein GGS24DRAFT_165412 [Hypoxylon argillaceum]|nr:hypothetical protein GGS24DRAFT_165412 [Hypoxylon argillaceum]
MANLPFQHPDLAIHLTDSALTPLITSARTQAHLDALTTLSHTALSAHESAARLGLGAPQRIMVERGDDGPVLLQTFLGPPRAAPPAAAAAAAATRTPSRHDSPHAGTLGDENGDGVASVATTAATAAPPDPRSTNGAQQQQQYPRQHHEGALALAAKNRDGSSAAAAAAAAAAPSTTTTTTTTTTATAAAYLRGGGGSSSYEDPSYPIFLGDEEDEDEDDSSSNPDAPPMLVGVVLAPRADQHLDARRAAVRLEAVAREIQAQWSDPPGQSPAPRGRGRAGDEHAAVD